MKKLTSIIFTGMLSFSSHYSYADSLSSELTPARDPKTIIPKAMEMAYLAMQCGQKKSVKIGSYRTIDEYRLHAGPYRFTFRDGGCGNISANGQVDFDDCFSVDGNQHIFIRYPSMKVKARDGTMKTYLSSGFLELEEIILQKIMENLPKECRKDFDYC